MRVEIGSYIILYDWHDLIKRRIEKDCQIQIAEQLSLGLKHGEFKKCFNGITDMSGWWIIKDEL